jgi:hypothetical protein
MVSRSTQNKLYCVSKWIVRWFTFVLFHHVSPTEYLLSSFSGTVTLNFQIERKMQWIEGLFVICHATAFRKHHTLCDVWRSFCEWRQSFHDPVASCSRIQTRLHDTNDKWRRLKQSACTLDRLTVFATHSNNTTTGTYCRTQSRLSCISVSAYLVISVSF